jgi:putative Flp pilus-assembly TadE/G-like protein
MRWLMNRLSRLHRGGREAGAVAVIVTVLVAGGVLLGMGAMTVDAGQMYAERAQLQNGADSGALAVALSCAKGSCNTSTAQTEANGNSNDGTSNDAVCGSGPGLSACAPPAPAARDCVTTPSGNYAQVTTSTRNRNGTTLLPPVLGRAVLGGSYNGKTVHACAQARWGAVGSATGFAATFSLCTWKTATSNGTIFAPAPPYSLWPPPGVQAYPKNNFDPTVPGLPGGEQVLQSHGSGNDCAGSPGSGWQLPGGFGWLNDPNGNCTAAVNVSNTYQDNTGVSISAACKTALQNAIASPPTTPPSVIYLPIYDGVQNSGGNGIYHLAGFAAFVVTGAYVNGSGGLKVPSTISGKNYCSGNNRCIYGFFTQGLVPGGTLGGTNFGASVVSLIG